MRGRPRWLFVVRFGRRDRHPHAVGQHEHALELARERKRLARGEQHQGDDPAVLRTRGGEITVYPAAWPLVQARPQTISPKALDRFLASGWATQPFAGVIEPEVH